MGEIDDTLRQLMLVMAGIYALSWASIAIAFRIYPRAAANFFLANLGIGLGTALVMERATHPGFLSIQVADWLVIGGIAACRSGIVFIVRTRPSVLALAAPWLLEILATAFVASDQSSYFYRAMVFNAIACGVAIAAFVDCIKGLHQNYFTPSIKLILASPFLASGLLFGVRLVQVSTQMAMHAETASRSQTGYVIYLWTFVVVLLAINIAMTGLVVARLLQKIREAADTDPLTACLNRRALGKKLALECERIKRSGLPLACAMFDLDHFKQINDQHGHEVGDAALVHVVHVIREAMRSVDVLGRYGGEEFVLLMPETSLGAAVEASQRFRKLLAEQPFVSAGRSIQLTGSFGVAAISPGDTGEDMIRRADLAKYEAKRLGRNRVEVAVDTAVLAQGVAPAQSV